MTEWQNPATSRLRFLIPSVKIKFKITDEVKNVRNVTMQKLFNPLTPNDPYMGRTATLTSKRCIFYIFSTNIGTEYFKHALYSPFFSLQNAVCFIMLTCLVPVLFTFYIQGVLKLKKNNSGAKGLNKIGNVRITSRCGAFA